MILQCSLEQLVETVRPLHQFERDADQEKPLKLGNERVRRHRAVRNACYKGSKGNDDIEDIPAVCFEAVEP